MACLINRNIITNKNNMKHAIYVSLMTRWIYDVIAVNITVLRCSEYCPYFIPTTR